MKPCGAPGRKRQGWMAEDQMKNENTGNGVARMVMPFFVCEKIRVGRGMLWSSIFVTLVAKKYHESVTLPSGLRMVYDNH